MVLLPNFIVVLLSKYGMCTCVLPYSTKFSRVFFLILQVLQIFNRSQQYLNKTFWHTTQFLRSACKSIDGQYPGAYATEYTKNFPQGDTY